MAGRRPRTLAKRIRLFVPPAFLFWASGAVMGADAPQSPFFHFGTYRIELGVFLGAVGLIAFYFAVRRA